MRVLIQFTYPMMPQSLKLAEDNADVQRAEYHWQTAQKLIEADLDSYRGGARPKMVIAPEGVGSGMGGMY